VARKGIFQRWYSGQEGALPPVVQWPGTGSSTGGTETSTDNDDPPTRSIDVNCSYAAIPPTCVFSSVAS
jgi:hypothetical protein